MTFWRKFGERINQQRSDNEKNVVQENSLMIFGTE